MISMEDVVREYEDYQDKIGKRVDLYREISNRFGISKALYPGSHIDISPSFVIPEVVYVDNFRRTIKFFRNLDSIKTWIDKNKEYDRNCDISFFGQDYSAELNIEPVDLIISQYAGFVGQATKKYLKVGGVLLCNDSHGDATLSRFDDDFKFIGIIDENNLFSDSDLDKYFIMPKGKTVNLIKVKENMCGPKYSKTAPNYIFRKIK